MKLRTLFAKSDKAKDKGEKPNLAKETKSGESPYPLLSGGSIHRRDR